MYLQGVKILTLQILTDDYSETFVYFYQTTRWQFQKTAFLIGTAVKTKFQYTFFSLTVYDFAHKHKSFSTVNHFLLTRMGLC